MFVACYWSRLCGKSQRAKQWPSVGREKWRLCKYLSGIDVDYLSVLFCSVRFSSPTDQIAAGNINIDIISALEMDATCT